MSINNSPILNTNCGLSEFRFWCQKVLPLVYDDSLSYYETLCKIANKLNEAITSANTSQENIVLLKQAYDELLEYINDYTKTLDETIVNSVNEKINNMAESGELFNYVVSRITAADVGAAPAGYGLGTQNPSRLTTLLEVDSAGNSGWYEVRLNGESIEGFTQGLLYVNASALVIEQVFAPYLSLCKLVRYWNVDYGWEPWEWVNSPMAIGVEYRTTERWQGKSVYTKVVNIGTLPDTAQKTINVGVNGSKWYEISGHAADHSLSHGVTFPSNEIVGYIGNDGVLYLTTTGNFTSYDATATIKYVKD